MRSEYVGAGGAQAPLLRVSLADGTLVAAPDLPPQEMLASLQVTSDVLGTGWFGADAAAVALGKTVAIIGDGAVGLCAVIAARHIGAERVIVMSRHAPRQKLAREFGATDIVTERGDEGVARIKDLTDGLGAHSVVEAVGSQEAMMQAMRSTRPGGYVGFAGVSHGVQLPGQELFYAEVHLHGGPAPVRRFLPELIDLVWTADQPRQGLRPDVAVGPGGRGLPRDGRAPCDQDAIAAVNAITDKTARSRSSTLLSGGC